MSINRRGFFKVLGLTGAALATGEQLNATPQNVSDKEFYGVLYDVNRCVGCRSCEYECATANNLPEPPDDIEPDRKTDEKHRTVVNEHNTSKGVFYTKVQCMHCNEPACVAACLTQAMYKTKEGPVTWRGNKCMGCRYCMVSCPFDIPKFEYFSPNPKIEKCTMCFDNKVQNGESPACVTGCPNEALMFGTRRELIREARRRIAEQPDVYTDHIYGEHEAGGTGWLYISPVPYEELGMKTDIQKASYPELTKTFLYSVPTIFVLVPALLAGIHQATKKNHLKEEEDEN
ncbi:MAG: 4Fe-4S dicluster domain-containing protein [Bacteroidales bacterium]|nr:4Fe-4S dicluster domain-containing protein [Bacteroidales bacterium]